MFSHLSRAERLSLSAEVDRDGHPALLGETMHKLTFHSDPGHGWLECPRSLLDTLGIAADVSPYSYTDGPRAYLEEDSDAGLLLRALDSRGAPYNVTEAHIDRDHPIRRLRRFI